MTQKTLHKNARSDWLQVVRKAFPKLDIPDQFIASSNQRVKFVCPKHGPGTVTVAAAVAKNTLKFGCKRCHGEYSQSTHQEKISGACRVSWKTWLQRFQKSHGKTYVYPQPLEVVKAHTPIKIVCHKHGEFFMTPTHHCIGCNCPECSSNVRVAGKFLHSIGDSSKNYSKLWLQELGQKIRLQSLIGKLKKYSLSNPNSKSSKRTLAKLKRMIK